MHYKSRYPPPPPTPIINIHDLVFNSPAQQEPADKLQFVEPLAGKKWSRNEFRERVHDCATALVAPVADGGLGFAHEGEMVAVMSTNCVVSTVPPNIHHQCTANLAPSLRACAGGHEATLGA